MGRKDDKNHRSAELRALEQHFALSMRRRRLLWEFGKQFIEHFSPTVPIAHFYMMEQIDVDYRAYIFLMTEQDVEAVVGSDAETSMRDFIFEALDGFEIGSREGGLTLALNFSSKEEVDRDFDGTFRLRMI